MWVVTEEWVETESGNMVVGHYSVWRLTLLEGV